MKRAVAADPENLALSDKLAIERTALAADRSLLAWVRTSLSLISFGFGIFKFLQFLTDQGVVSSHMRPHTPRNLGLFLILMGTVPLFFVIVQHIGTMRRMGKTGKALLTPGLFAIGIVFVFGIFLAATVIFRIVVL